VRSLTTRMFNIFVLVFFAIVVALALAVLITRSPLPEGTQLVLPEEDADMDPKDKRDLTMADLQSLAEELCKENQLKIKERIENNSQDIYWITENKNEFYYGNYVFAFLSSEERAPLVKLQQILGFKDFVKSVGSTKGFFFTTGYFTRDIHQPLEGAKINLYNRKKGARRA